MLNVEVTLKTFLQKETKIETVKWPFKWKEEKVPIKFMKNCWMAQRPTIFSFLLLFTLLVTKLAPIKKYKLVVENLTTTFKNKPVFQN